MRTFFELAPTSAFDTIQSLTGQVRAKVIACS
jgi:hypothetical protein